MKLASATLIASLLALAAGCHASSPHGGTSGSNWLTCSTVQDCDVLDAETCSEDGYCLDGHGEPLPADTGAPPAVRAPNKSYACQAGLDALATAAGLDLGQRVDCGISFGTEDAAQMRALTDCYQEALAQGQAAQLTVQGCPTCRGFTGFIGQPDGTGYFVKWSEGDSPGLAIHAELGSFEDLRWQETSAGVPTPQWEYGPMLYQCDTPSPRDGPNGGGPVDFGAPLTLDLLVSNSSTAPLANITVAIDGESLVMDAFESAELSEGPRDYDKVRAYPAAATPTSGRSFELRISAQPTSAPDVTATQSLELDLRSGAWLVVDYVGDASRPFHVYIDSGRPVPVQ